MTINKLANIYLDAERKIFVELIVTVLSTTSTEQSNGLITIYLTCKSVGQISIYRLGN